MQKGGYQIIDLENKNHIRGVGMLHEGVYSKIESTRKPILLSGLVVDGKEYHDTFVAVMLDGSVFRIKISMPSELEITIEDTDVVKVEE